MKDLSLLLQAVILDSGQEGAAFGSMTLPSSPWHLCLGI